MTFCTVLPCTKVKAMENATKAFTMKIYYSHNSFHVAKLIDTCTVLVCTEVNATENAINTLTMKIYYPIVAAILPK